ncbi:MAG: DUF6452 family protein [Flavobacterium sp.]|jgi:hypothetical protein
MKKYIKTVLLLLFAVSFWNCEKDDICAESTPTTPRVVIEFYDAANPTVLKNATNLRIEEVGTTNGVVSNTALDDTNPLKYLFNSSKVFIPLKTFDDISGFNFKFNYDAASENSDEIVFNYTRQNIYVSRACGYKTNFTLDATTGAVLTPDGNNWIQSITIEQPTIANENETHIKIYF